MKKTILLAIIFMILFSSISYGESNKKVLIIAVDSLSFEEINKLKVENLNLALFNIKTRPTYSLENFYLSLNLGRKVNSNNDIDFQNYMGDLLRDKRPVFLGNENSEVSNLLIDSNGRVGKLDYSNINRKNFKDKINLLLNDHDLLAFDNTDGMIDLEFLLKEASSLKNTKTYVLGQSVSEKDTYFVNRYLVPIIVLENSQKGLITSVSTKRDGIVTIEDISEDIKSNFNRENEKNIGNKFSYIPKKNPKKDLEVIYKDTIESLFKAIVSHGIIYLSQGLLAYFFLKEKTSSDLIYNIFLFSTNNIFIGLLLSFLKIDELYLYLIISILMNLIIIKFIKKFKISYSKLMIGTYMLILMGLFINNNAIYNSPIGFNNLIYGARYYGLNNGIVGVFLITSLFFIFELDKLSISIKFKNFFMVLIAIINMVSLSGNVGANTGGFLTSVFLLFILLYFYIFNKDKNIVAFLVLIIILILIFSINMYFDKGSHAIKLINRIKENGAIELLEMGIFKMKELVRLTIIPPFSLVLISQIYILYRMRKFLSPQLKISLLISIFGFIINDTGNILLIYMMNYVIVHLISERINTR